jgi:hypothetical protein
VSLLHQLVNFRVSDVYFPDPAEVLLALHGKDLLQGRVVDVSGGGAKDDQFVVVQVEGIQQPIIVSEREIKIP